MSVHSTDKMRIGSKYEDDEFVSNLMKILIFKSTAIHSSSTNSIADVLNSKWDLIQGVDCPRLIVTTFPACQGTYFYYKMTSGYLTGSDQTVVDSSGNGVDGINGSSASVDNKDCSA